MTRTLAAVGLVLAVLAEPVAAARAAEAEGLMDVAGAFPF